MTINEVQNLKGRWAKMNDAERWKLVMELGLEITLDNDNTSVWISCTEDEDMGENLFFEKDIGNRRGIDVLLSTVGIKFQHC